jgi:transposase
VEKVLEDAGIKLSVFVSDMFGVSGRAMLAALIAGERDPQVLAEHARARMRTKIPVLVEALTGRFDEHHAFLCATMLAHIDTLDATINTITAHIEAQVQPFQALVDRLDTIPGVNQRAAQTILAEIGTDMSRFPTAGHLASWAGVCPGNNESAGKHHPTNPAKATPGCAPLSARPPPQDPAPRTAICTPNTGGWPAGVGRSGPCSPSATPS